MSDTIQARRTHIEAVFAGTDITPSLQKYFLSMTYTDNEEDATDDLQIKLQDRDEIWLEKWLNTAIQASADLEIEETEKKYKVTAKSGVTIHSSAKEDSKSEGTLAYGTIVDVKSIEDGWAKIEYSDKTGNVKSEYLTPIYTSSNDTVATSETSTSSPSGNWNIGDEVTVSGRPQMSSYGTGSPGAEVTNYKGSITYLNLKDGIPYPIHVGSLGWFAESQVQGSGSSSGDATSEATEATEGAASKGLKIQAAIVRENWIGDGKSERLECGQFELDSVTPSGPPATITIKGTSLPYSSTIRQTKKSRPWENCTLKNIAEEIAGNNGMTVLFLSAEDPSYSRIEQFRTSDIAFLQKLCQDAGFSLKITNNEMVIFDQAAYESQTPIRTIQHGKGGGYSKYKLQTGENNIYTSCHVCYVTPDGNLIEATVYSRDYEEPSDKTESGKSDDNKKNQCLEIRQKVESVDEAKALGEKMLRLHNKHEFTGSFTFPGDTTLLAGCTVTLVGWGAFDGQYIIKQAKHVVGGDGYETQITIRRVLVSAFDKYTSGGNSDNSGGKSIDELAQEVIRGDWGNGEDRKQRLTDAGYDYNKVQARVNEIL